MKEKLKKVYYCDYCKKHWLVKTYMEYHESICSKNPANDRPCFHCRHLGKNEVVIYGEYRNGQEYSFNLEVLYCNKNKCFLHTPKNEIKGNILDLGEPNNPMPKKCDIFDKEMETELLPF